jgi:hypothetical protein
MLGKPAPQSSPRWVWLRVDVRPRSTALVRKAELPQAGFDRPVLDPELPSVNEVRNRVARMEGYQHSDVPERGLAATAILRRGVRQSSSSHRQLGMAND